MKARTALLAACAVFLAALVLPAFISGYGIRILNLALISAIAVIGLNFAFGYAGLMTSEGVNISLLFGAVSFIVGLVGGLVWILSAEKAAQGTASIEVP